jgi:outer membrane biosynthesis protein TonB
MPRMPPNASRVDPRLDPIFVERERNRFAARALAFLILLNGAAALVMLSILANAPASTVEPKFATAMLFFGGGAIAALLSSFLAYINRTVAMEAPQRASLRQALLILAILAVIGAGVSFMTGINMVATAASERSSTHPKGAKEQPAPKEQPGAKDQQQPKSQSTPEAKPSERVQKQQQELFPGLIELRWDDVRT